MPQLFTLRSALQMDDSIRDKIVAAGVPIDLYYNGYLPLGPVNKTSVTKFANINTLITANKLPIPPSKYYDWVVERCTGLSKQDWREIIDGDPGMGKSTSGIFGCGVYAMMAAEKNGQDPKDYFTIDNCALLQDTAGVTHLMDELDKYQAVLIDDAGVSAGHKDFATTSNKNLDAIMATCRTKRWYVVFTAPMNKHIDLNIRELVYTKSSIFKPCHAAGFNILKRKRIKKIVKGSKYIENNPHFVYDDVRIDLYAAFTPDYLDPYKGIVETYEKARDAAADSLIHERATEESDKKNRVTAREKKFSEEIEKHEATVYRMTHTPDGKWLDRRTTAGFKKSENAYSIRAITGETGLSEHKINMIIARLKQQDEKVAKK